MQIYDIAIAPGVPRQVDAVGDYFYFYSGSASGLDASIRLQGRSSGLQIMLMPGQSYKLPPGASETTWILTNRLGQGTIVGNVIIGNGGIDDNRITGEVSVLDNSFSRSYGGIAFNQVVVANAPASNYPHLQLWNGSASQWLEVNKIMLAMNAGAATSVAIGNDATQLSTAAPAAPAFKRFGAGSAGPQGRIETRTTLKTLGDSLFDVFAQPGVPLQLDLGDPIVLAPGTGLTLVSFAVASGLTASLQCRMRSI